MEAFTFLIVSLILSNRSATSFMIQSKPSQIRALSRKQMSDKDDLIQVCICSHVGQFKRQNRQATRAAHELGGHGCGVFVFWFG